VTDQSLAPTAPPGITPQDHERLLEAAREALALLDRIDRHAPDGLTFGGEGRVRRVLRDAIRACSFELRPCAACGGPTTHATPRHPPERPRLVPCGECSGSGRVRVFTYPTKRTRSA
jgi:hypothetical protein